MFNLRKRGMQVNQYPLPVRNVTNAVFHAACAEIVALVSSDITFEYTEVGVPESGKGIHKMYHAACAGGTFKVFSGANDAALLYFTPETNLAYRAVHDLDHASAYAEGRGTTSRADELYLNCLMAKRVYQYALANEYTRKQALLAFFEVYHDTVGQVHYYFEHNDFCTNQKGLTAELVSNCRGVRAVLAGDIFTASTVMQSMLDNCAVPYRIMGGLNVTYSTLYSRFLVWSCVNADTCPWWCVNVHVPRPRR